MTGAEDHDGENDYSPNPDFNRPKLKAPETLEARMAADKEWCDANGTPEMFYAWYPWMRQPERDRSGRGGR